MDNANPLPEFPETLTDAIGGDLPTVDSFDQWLDEVEARRNVEAELDAEFCALMERELRP